jgi:hypothetical protein
MANSGHQIAIQSRYCRDMRRRFAGKAAFAVILR